MAVVFIVVSVDLLVALVLAYADLESDLGLLELARQHVIDPTDIGFAIGGTVLLVALGSAYKALDLWGGGPVVAEHLGGRRLNSDTTVPTERQLLNVVEEMAIASGMATPPVYLLEDEDGINAFAVGYELEDAVIVSRAVRRIECLGMSYRASSRMSSATSSTVTCVSTSGSSPSCTGSWLSR